MWCNTAVLRGLIAAMTCASTGDITHLLLSAPCISLAVARQKLPFTELRRLQAVRGAVSHSMHVAKWSDLCRGNFTYSPFDAIFFKVMQPDNGSAQLGPRLYSARFVVQSVVRTLEQPSITVLHQLSQEVMDMT